MTMPIPEDLGRAPAWENYVVGQAVQASLGGLPEHALAVGVEIAGRDVLLRFQLSELAESDREDMDDIFSELAILVGREVRIDKTSEILDEREVSPHDGVRWIYLARQRPRSSEQRFGD